MLIAYVCTFLYIALSLMIFDAEGRTIIRKGSLKKYFKNQNIAGYFMLVFNPLSLVLLISFYYNIDTRENKEHCFFLLNKLLRKVLNYKPFKD